MPSRHWRGAGTLTEIGLAWIYRRLIVALHVDGRSGELADRLIDERIRYAEIADDRVFGASDVVEAADIVTAKIGEYAQRHTGIRSRDRPQLGREGHGTAVHSCSHMRCSAARRLR